MIGRLLSICLIFATTCVAWFILGSTIHTRTWSRGPILRDRVESNWGGPHTQRRPAAWIEVPPPSPNMPPRQIHLTPDSTRAEADLRLEHRQKGLLWYSTYAVAFSGRWTFRNPSADSRAITIVFPFPAAKSIYDDLVFTIDGKPADLKLDSSGATATVPAAPGQVLTLETRYRSQALESRSYEFGKEVAAVKDFQLTVSIDFPNPDFPEGGLSPTEKRRTEHGWDLVWSYRNLMSGQQVRITMPEKLQPGPLAGQISYFAPVSLLFFFFVLLMITTLRRIDLHPMHYFFLAASFFTFHLLLAYLVDHISIHLAFIISSLVSLALTVSYLRLITGFRFAAREAALAQFVYLVLFSYAFFFEGFTGLAVTIGAIVTLFVTMQMTGRINWNSVQLTAPSQQQA